MWSVRSQERFKQLSGKSLRFSTSKGSLENQNKNPKVFTQDYSGDSRYKLVGASNESTVLISGVECKALIDTGSMVTTVSSSFYKAYLAHQELCPISTLRVEGADGRELPFSGFVECSIVLLTDCVKDFEIYVPILVVADTDYNMHVPLVVGTNIIQPAFDQCIKIHGNSFIHVVNPSNAWRLAYISMVMQDRNKGPQLLTTDHSITVKGESHQQVKCCIGTIKCNKGSVLMIESTNHLPGSLLVVPGIVDQMNDRKRQPHVLIDIVNISSREIVIPVNNVICSIQSVNIEESSGGDSTVNPFLDLFNFQTCEDHLNLVQLNQLQELLTKWQSVFSMTEFDLGKTDLIEHRIELQDEAPFKQRHHRIPPHLYDEVRKHIQEMLDAGVIRSSKSPFASPVVLVRKKDKSLRFCIDYRFLNARTKKDSYALPRFEECVDVLHGSQYFSCLDLKKGYYQVGVHEQHKERTAFTAGQLGFYEFNVLPMGLCNAPASFQRMMEMCMGERYLDSCLVFLDDVIVFSKSFEEHLTRLDGVLQKLHEAGLKLKPSKCQFMKTSVNYLGHIISKDGIKTDDKKIECLKKWPVPTSVDQVRSFLGFTGYYRRFVKGYSKIVKPLTDLLAGAELKTKKSGKRKMVHKQKWKWSITEQAAFTDIITKLCEAPVLAYADFTQPFELRTDASGSGLGAVLYQVQDGKQCVIAYASRGLTKAEKNYPVHKLEFLALKWAVSKKFHDYLYGAEFIVKTDNNPLTYVQSTAKLDAASQRWQSELANYDFKIVYLSGKENIEADALSRLPALQANLIGTDKDTMSYNVCVNEQALQLQEKDYSISVVIDLLRQGKKPTSTDSSEVRSYSRDWKKLEVHDNVLYHVKSTDGCNFLQLVIPTDVRTEILDSIHNDMGHLGRDRTLDLLQQRCFWPGLYTSVDTWIKKCDRCIRRKTLPQRAPLVSIESHYPLQLVCMDYLSLERSSGGYENILVMVDHYSKFAVAIPTRNQTAKTTARVIFNSFIVHYGLPTRLHSDQGTNFESKIIKELCVLLSIDRSHTTPYHPIGDGITERLNRTILNMMGTLVEERKAKWKDYLPKLIHCYNSTKHDSTGYSPYYLMFGRHPRLSVDIMLGNVLPNVSTPFYTEFAKETKSNLTEASIIVNKNNQDARDQQKHYYDRSVRGSTVKVGDTVLVRRFQDVKGKLSDPWELEVFKVVSQRSDLPVFTVEGVKSGKKKTLHRNLLLPVGCTTEVEEDLESSSDESSYEQVSSCEDVPIRRSNRECKPPDRLGINKQLVVPGYGGYNDEDIIFV